MKSNHSGQELVVSGYCVYSNAMHFSTGNGLAAATLKGADRAVSLRVGQVGLCFIESKWTEAEEFV